jgi:hypothetical protein
VADKLSEHGCCPLRFGQSWIFFLFYIFLSSFFKNIWSVKKFAKLRIHLAPRGTAAETYRRADGVTYLRGTVAPATVMGHGGRGPVYFQKFVFFVWTRMEVNFIWKL